MDRYIVRELRVGADYPQGNQMIAVSPNVGSNNMIPQETVYFGGYGAEFPDMQRVGGSGYIGVTHVNQPYGTNIMQQNQGANVSGIDPRYLVGYAENNASYSYIAGQQPSREQACPPSLSGPTHPATFTNEHQNRSFNASEWNKPKALTPQVGARAPQTQEPLLTEPIGRKPMKGSAPQLHKGFNHRIKSSTAPAVVKPTTSSETELLKNESTNLVLTRAERLKQTHKSGPRAFSGPVEKVLKWHKALQDIGILIIYEIVAKCVSVSPGESCAKNLVVRDENGPAMQVVYYEIDFMLPELKPPCTVRVIGRMMPGTCRLQAFNVRAATGDDVATLPRRAAVAEHHVHKLCQEFAS